MKAVDYRKRFFDRVGGEIGIPDGVYTDYLEAELAKRDAELEKLRNIENEVGITIGEYIDLQNKSIDIDKFQADNKILREALENVKLWLGHNTDAQKIIDEVLKKTGDKK
jgi:hypothetical protein